MNSYLSIEEFFEEMERERAAMPWYRKTFRYVKNTPYRVRLYVYDFFGNLVNRYQRSKFGIGYRDMWNFPGYIAGVVAHAAELHAEEGHTYPGEERGFTEEEWREFLLIMARELREHQESYNSLDYGEGWFNDYDLKLERARNALHRFASEFEYIGD